MLYDKLDQLISWRKSVEQKRQQLSVVAGSFRILQPGNLYCLKQAVEKFGNVCVIIDPETSRQDIDIPSSRERGSLPAHINGVGAVAVFQKNEITSCLNALRPFVLTDCSDEPSKCIIQKSAKSLAEKVYDIEPLKGFFTENIIKAIHSGRTPMDCPSLPAVLQRPFAEDIGLFLAGLKGKKIVTVNGCFDILHPGHLRLLTRARQMGDALIVLVNDNESVRRYKGGRRPVFPVPCRLAVLHALKPVSAAFAFSGDNPLAMLEKIKPAVHVKGGSFVEERARAEQTLIESWGGRLEFVEMMGNYSTSDIIAKLNK